MTTRTNHLEDAPTTPPDTGQLPGAGARRPGGRPAQRGRVLTTKVGLHLPPGIDFEEWERTGCRLSGIVDSSSWWLGDWLVYGKRHYADRYQRGIRAAGLSYQTLRNYAWVARRFPPERRREALTFQHHAEITSLPVTEQDRWLDRAEENGWTTKQLRGALRTARADDAEGAGDAGRTSLRADRGEEPVHRLALTGSRVEWWHEAARRSGLELEQWVTQILDLAAGDALGGARSAVPAGV
ncbi:LmbU family transcriptional regulator [Streptomyces sp. NPDC047315]|uniref:LmbU family transcriptional regulator n=1 Tax=Streptomyces sp. NPDC047315 TaxID=3155142 RepID=UPI0033E93100